MSLAAGLFLRSLPLLSMGILNLFVFLCIGVPFLLLSFRIRKIVIFPVLPHRMDDASLLKEYCRDIFPVSRGLRFSCLLDLQWEEYRSLQLSSSDRGPGEGTTDRFCRGIYTINSCKLVVRDRFNLFRTEFSRDYRQILTVYPAGNGTGSQALLKRFSSEARTASRSLLKDSSYYESRLYSPGDDPRRINWKLQARFGSLFVKDGYTASPSGKKILMLADGRGALPSVDNLYRECRSLLEALLEHGFDIYLHATGMSAPVKVSVPFGQDGYNTLLASAPPVPFDAGGIDLSVSYGAVFLFTADTSILEKLKGDLFTSERVLKFLFLPENETQRQIRGGWHVSEIR